MRALFALLLAAVACVADDSDDRLRAGAASNERSLGEKALRAGQLKVALAHYDKSIQLAPKDPQNYYQRASALMIDRKYAAAEKDLNQALELDPKFVQALKKRGRMFAGQGRLDSALKDYQEVLKAGKADAETQQALQKVESAAKAAEEGRILAQQGQWQRALDSLNVALDVAADSVDLLMLRAETRSNLGDQEGVLLDTGLALKVKPGYMAALLLRGQVYYYMNDFDLATRHFREGLRQDPEHREFGRYMKLMKGMGKQAAAADEAFKAKNWAKALEEYTAAANMDVMNVPYTAKMVLGQCKSLVKLGKGKDAIATCSRQIELQSEEKADRSDRAQAFVQRADAHILLDDYDEGIRDYERAKHLTPDDRSIQEGLDQAKRKLKMSKRKDYYKILGIPSNSDDRAIRKAYKKLAMLYHPDKASPEEKDAALVKFRDVSEAHEILSDPEKRARFDSGEEVDQPEQQHNPFAAFQQFHFHFG